VTYTATVYPFAPGVGTPSGTINFYDGSTLIGSAETLGGQAVLNVSASGVGLVHNIRTVFTPSNTNFGTSSSFVFSQTVSKTDSTVVLNAQFFPGGVGFPSFVVATVPGGGIATGKVTFFINGKAFATQSLNNALAKGIFLPKAYSIGKTIRVSYSGDQNFNAGESDPLLIRSNLYDGAMSAVKVFRQQNAKIVRGV
jgi:hypothetical protein